MPKAYDTPVWKREKWKTERDGKHVPKGAVSGVDMGGALQKFHEEHAKGLTQGLAECKKLQVTVNKYLAGIEKKYPEFHASVKTRLLGNVTGYIGAVTKIAGCVPKYAPARKAAWDEITKQDQAHHTHQTLGNPIAEFKLDGATLQDKAEKLQDVLDDLMFCSDKIKEDDRREFEVFVKRLQAGKTKGQDGVTTLEGLQKRILKFPANL
jgi:hypothetical protein